MAGKSKPWAWKAGRGKLGAFAPLVGAGGALAWVARAKSEMGPVRCTRIFTSILGARFIQLDAAWTIGGGDAVVTRTYREHCVFGPDSDGVIGFWSFASDGKRSQGRLADGTDVHPKALCFESRMDAGLARQIYWPDAAAGVRWAVEARTKSGWRRFTEHHYQASRQPPA